MPDLIIFRFQRRMSSLFNPIKVTRNLLWRYGSGISEQGHVFVVGAPRSGTTLMFTVLSSHPSFSAIECETFFFIPRDVFNAESYSRFFNLGGVTKEEIVHLLDNSKNLVHLHDNLAKFINQRDCKLRFVEKTPLHVLYLKFLTKHFPNAKFINMIRDGRDGYVSNNRLPSQFHMSTAKFASLWRDSIRVRQKVGNHPQIMDVIYEDFVKNPLEVTRKIMNFIGEDFLDIQIDPGYYSKTKIFRGMKGHERLNQPIKPTSIGKWREEMTFEEIAIFNRIAGRELKELNYEVN